MCILANIVIGYIVLAKPALPGRYRLGDKRYVYFFMLTVSSSSGFMSIPALYLYYMY